MVNDRTQIAQENMYFKELVAVSPLRRCSLADSLGSQDRQRTCAERTHRPGARKLAERAAIAGRASSRGASVRLRRSGGRRPSPPVSLGRLAASIDSRAQRPSFRDAFRSSVLMRGSAVDHCSDRLQQRASLSHARRDQGQADEDLERTSALPRYRSVV